MDADCPGEILTVELGRDASALLVIDMQNGFCRDEGSIARIGFDIAMLKNAIAPCVRLVTAARRAGVPVIHTRYVYQPGHVDGGVLVDALMPQLRAENALVAGDWDSATIDELAPIDGETVIDKNRPSAFYRTSLDAVLETSGITQLAICGVTTNCCVESTVRDASQRDYETFVISDATGELDAHRHDAALSTMGLLFAQLTSTADVERAFAHG
jgi:ureidoacrylate peracid hydrolase